MKPQKSKQFSHSKSDNFILPFTKIPQESYNIVVKRAKIILEVNVNSSNYQKKKLMFIALRSEF
jgi:hypothetical protein